MEINQNKNQITQQTTHDEKTDITDIKEIIMKIEKILIPIFDYINENEAIIEISGKLWNNVFNIVNLVNKIKTSSLDMLGIPKSEDIWKTIYEAEKINQQLYLAKLQLENKKIKLKKEMSN